MRNKLIEYKLNDRWSISSDRWNWILLDYQNTRKPIMSFYSNLEQLSRALLDLKAKDALARPSITRGYISPPVRLNPSILDEIAQELELFLQGLINNEKTK